MSKDSNLARSPNLKHERHKYEQLPSGQCLSHADSLAEAEGDEAIMLDDFSPVLTEESGRVEFQRLVPVVWVGVEVVDVVEENGSC